MQRMTPICFEQKALNAFVSDDVAGDGTMKRRIGSAPGLVRTIAAHRHPFGHRPLQQRGERRRPHHVVEAILAEMTQAEREVSGFREHAPLVGGVDAAVVVVDDASDPDPRRRLQIDVS